LLSLFNPSDQTQSNSRHDEEDLPNIDVEGKYLQEVNGESKLDETSSGLDDVIQTFEGHEGTLFAVACSPVYATWVASGCGDDKAFIGHATPFFALEGHTYSVVALSFNNDGILFASGGLDGVIHVWFGCLFFSFPFHLRKLATESPTKLMATIYRMKKALKSTNPREIIVHHTV